MEQKQKTTKSGQPAAAEKQFPVQVQQHQPEDTIVQPEVDIVQQEVAPVQPLNYPEWKKFKELVKNQKDMQKNQQALVDKMAAADAQNAAAEAAAADAMAHAVTKVAKNAKVCHKLVCLSPCIVLNLTMFSLTCTRNLQPRSSKRWCVYCVCSLFDAFLLLF